MSGYPTVVNYGTDGRPLPMHVTHMGTAHAVVLRHGQHASFDLRYTNPVISNCTPEQPAQHDDPHAWRAIAGHRRTTGCRVAGAGRASRRCVTATEEFTLFRQDE